ncbi:hypothetical protein GCM10010124_39310 [Pilimelia terevasa]|uniref:Uncharacterized protein n=1 Tax=Pilimelia terevasa TaxID=53372 RepID=A0A8J3FK50_9ACTN|nr:hypothetical protein GCM10010124_39310 [Pilimelia terevasa]
MNPGAPYLGVTLSDVTLAGWGKGKGSDTEGLIAALMPAKTPPLTLPELEQFVASRAVHLHRIVPLDPSGRVHVPDLIERLNSGQDTKLVTRESTLQRLVIGVCCTNW